MRALSYPKNPRFFYVYLMLFDEIKMTFDCTRPYKGYRTGPPATSKTPDGRDATEGHKCPCRGSNSGPPVKNSVTGA